VKGREIFSSCIWFHGYVKSSGTHLERMKNQKANEPPRTHLLIL